MSDPIMPKEKLTAYQRWELTALSGRDARSRSTRAAGDEPITLPTAREIEEMHQAAHNEGFAEGRARATALAAQLEAVLGSVTSEVQKWETQIAEDIVSLAVEIARHVVRESLAVRKELIVPVVRDAMQQMPLFNAPVRLGLHPADVELVREEIGDQLSQLGWKIVEDERVEPGGCRIESAASQIDATNATRWERITAALGRDRAWLDRRPSLRKAPEPRIETRAEAKVEAKTEPKVEPKEDAA